MKLTQKALHRLLSVFFSKLQGISHFDLIFKIELITFPTGQMMQTVSHVTYELKRLPHGLKFIMRQKTIILEVSELFEIRFQSGNPEHGVIVSQSTLAFLEIGFEQIRRISETFMSALADIDQLLYDFS